MDTFQYDWYQLAEYVTFDIFAKNVDKESVEITFEADKVTVKFPTTGSLSYSKTFQLYGRIVSDSCMYHVKAMKIEITMKKAQSIEWQSLERPTEPSSEAKADAKSYPSSSRVKHDWVALDKAITEELEDEKESIDAFFKKIYSSANEESQRAMMKSFVESKGTVLSTNWEDIGSRKVDPSPPSGIEIAKD